MNYLTRLIYIDKSLGSFLVFILQLIQLSINFFKKEKKSFNSFEEIFVIKFLGIGSISRTSNLIQSLKIKYPYAKINFISFYENESFLKIFKHIDKIFLIEKKNIFYLIFSTMRLIFNYNLKKKSLLIDLEAH